ncbi:hypothetical protein MUN82_02365 [Hymenobacter aerilatus]|uniref:Uncharacterized protein n=1 Tax=Hymenobacter aerilatus TaxID=2932251 RepID=A0A8T9T1J1_9BACT|nr:hypothetical protein [Hymenobacter aerilatus]UOR05956.1 hypothetical protein MUN82_02365 [Hymenobacter aerilatus]
MRQKVREWLRRYLPAELASVVATLAGAALAYAATHQRITAALAGTWAGNVAYFGLILARDVHTTRRRLQAAGRPYALPDLLRNLRALVVEFGVAEVLDSFLIRPTLLYYMPLWVGNFAGGVLLAKFAADITFYVPAIIGYELSKRRFR